jgi:dolichol kinase
MDKEQFEIKRKLFHSLGLLCPIIYYFIPKAAAVAISLSVAVFVVTIDVYRHQNKYIQEWVEFFFKNFIRNNERSKDNLSGCSWMFIGVFLTCILYEKDIAIYSWIVLFICDSAAAVIGVKYGKNEIISGKTYEGSIAFFIIALISGIFYHLLFFPNFGFFAILVASFAGTISELYSKTFGIDDNISIPVAVGLTLTIL